jgi:hypothetical protein
LQRAAPVENGCGPNFSKANERVSQPGNDLVDQMATGDDVIIRGALEEYIKVTANKRAGYAIGKIVEALGKILDDQNRRIQKLETVISKKLAR